METDTIKTIKSLVSSINEKNVISIRNKLEEIIDMLSDQDKIDNVIKQIKNMIKTMNEIIDSVKNFQVYMDNILSFNIQMNDGINNIRENVEKLVIDCKIKLQESKEIIDDEEGKYIGNVINGIKEGSGNIHYKSGNEYQGEWKNGLEKQRYLLL